ncbi:MAG: hypothetical protein CHACPFDD_03470 [Phycisphaerae bacterium]|nr:hypothetical protein [Phycisphaerae bacterium]
MSTNTHLRQRFGIATIRPLSGVAAALTVSFGVVPVGCVGPQHVCPINRVPIIFTTPGDPASGEIGGMVLPVVHEGRVRYLAVDTGSALTFLYLGRHGPEFLPRAGTVRIGCERLPLPGRAFDADDETGIGIIGVLGADYFVTVPCRFDPAGGLVTRFPDRRRSPATQPSHGAQIPFENVGGHVVVRLNVDGHELRLLWDTGCPHLLWLGAEGGAGDQTVTGQDVAGGQFTMHSGHATLRIPGEPPREIVALRVGSFPYLEGTIEALGGGIDGLAGQSVFGTRSMFFDPAASVIRLGPAPVPNRRGGEEREDQE